MPAHEPIAIIGIGCRYPGDAEDPGSFWRLLQGGVDAVSGIPGDRWNIDTFYDPDPAIPGKTNSRWGGFVRDIDKFDAAFFGISPREAASIDPQQRMLVETAWQAIEDAGIVIDPATGSDAGVFVGISTYDYAQIQASFSDKTSIGAHSLTGGVLSIAANRISYLFNLRGPSLVADTACSSSLVAVHMACRSLREGECPVALAGGVNAIISPDTFVGFTRMSVLSPDGRCKAFDASANGFVRGEGAGVVVLKPLRAAVANGDHIYALIRGSAVNQDGKTTSLTVPGFEAQKKLIRQACNDAGIEPSNIEFVEAHGTGTALGDPIEAAAIGEVIGHGKKGSCCLVGSVKTNIGHLEAGSGVAGLIKATLALHHGEVPPSLHFKTPNPAIDFNALKLSVPVDVQKLAHKNALAGVNSFGFGGTNAHVVLQRHPQESEPAQFEPVGARLMVFSARDEAGLEKIAGQYAGWLPSAAARFDDICHTLAEHRAHLPHRLAVAAMTGEEAAEKLGSFLQGKTARGLTSGIAKTSRNPVFVFTGQGPQWWGMGRELLESDETFRSKIQECDTLFRQWGNWSLAEEMSRPESESRMGHPAIAQPAIFALQVALVAWWREQGVEPAAVVGHSVGEAAAAHVCGALDLPAAARVIFERGRSMEKAPANGRMLAVALPPEETLPWLAGLEKRAELAAVNGPRSVVVSGEADALEKMSRKMREAGVGSRFLQVTYAFHSRQMDALKKDLLRSLRDLGAGTPSLPVCSTVSGEFCRGTAFGPRYWWDNVRQPVLFARAIDKLLEAGHRDFLEVGPNPALSGPVTECLRIRGLQGTVATSLRRGEPERATLLASLGALHVIGAARHLRSPGARAALPARPWNRERHWHEADESLASRTGPAPHPLLGPASDASSPSWHSITGTEIIPWLRDHRLNGRIIFPAAAYVEMALAAGDRIHSGKPFVVEDLVFDRALLFDEAGTTVRLEFVYDTADRSFRISTRGRGLQGWTTHCTGRMRSGGKSFDGADLEAIKGRCAQRIENAAIYESFRNTGLEFGEEFRRIETIWRRDGESLAQVRGAPEGHSGRYVLHPAVIDACFQASVAALDASHGSSGLFLPKSIGRVRLGVGGEVKFSHVDLKSFDGERLLADVEILGEGGSLLARIEDFCCEAANRPDNKPQPLEDCYYGISWKECAAPDRDEGSIPPTVVLGGIDKASPHICDLLAALGHECGEAGDINSAEAVSGGTAKPMHAVYLSGWNGEPDADSAASECLELSRIVRELASRAGRHQLTIITCRGQAVSDTSETNPAAAAAIGFGRVLSNEVRDMRCRSIDLDPGDWPTDPKALEAEMQATDEDEIVLRGSRRLAMRIERAVPKPRALHGETTPFRLEVTKPGALENTAFRVHRRKDPARGDVEVEVAASGLNFRDVMKILGIYPIEHPADHLLGDECAGHITAVGEDVQGLRVGDDVVVIAPGCFATHVTVPTAFVAPRPANLSVVEAAAVPVAFLTAHYALHHLARIGRGERVLIHAAAGGVGMAAMQICKLAGAAVFATAGTPDKRAMLLKLGAEAVMDSRSLEFADEIMKATGGRGVDIVLNSLAGEALTKSVSLLAPYGRFLEIGKRDIYQGSRLGLRPFSRNLSFYAIDMGALLRDRPAFVAALLRELMQHFAKGELQPIPTSARPITRASEAFREMAQGKHHGKLVLRMERSGARVAPEPDESLVLDPHGTYLVTGGTRGFGLAIAEWLESKGARHLVLLGSTPESAEAARKNWNAAGKRGVNVVAEAVDISQREGVAALLEKIRTTMPPLKGIVHAAAKVDDCLASDLTPQRLRGVLSPKVRGAWNLHELTLNDGIDFFVMTSSMSSMVGNPGQANYSAANNYLNALAHYRRRQGLPALAVNFGHIGEVGYASRNSAVANHLERIGIPVLLPAEALVMLERLMLSESPVAGALRVDWARWSEMHQQVRPSRKFESLAPSVAEAGAIDEKAADTARLASAVLSSHGAKRVDLLEQFVQHTAARILQANPSSIDRSRPLADYGLDSLMGIELVNRIEAGLGMRVPVEQIGTGPSVRSLAAVLESNMPAARESR